MIELEYTSNKINNSKINMEKHKSEDLSICKTENSLVELSKDPNKNNDNSNIKSDYSNCIKSYRYNKKNNNSDPYDFTIELPLDDLNSKSLDVTDNNVKFLNSKRLRSFPNNPPEVLITKLSINRREEEKLLDSLVHIKVHYFVNAISDYILIYSEGDQKIESLSNFLNFKIFNKKEVCHNFKFMLNISENWIKINDNKLTFNNLLSIYKREAKYLMDNHLIINAHVV